MSVKQHTAFSQLKAGALLVFDTNLLRPNANLRFRPVGEADPISSFNDFIAAQEAKEAVVAFLVEPGKIRMTLTEKSYGDEFVKTYLWSATVLVDEHTFLLWLYVKNYHLHEIKSNVFKVFEKNK